MRPEPKKRIETQGASSPLSHLGDAFSELELSKLVPAAADMAALATAKPSPPTAATMPWKLGRVVLRREKAHRGGKTVIAVDDFATHLPLSVIEEVARKLRAACGSGGTVKGRTIEIQGDQPAKVRTALEAEGFRVDGV